MERDNLEALIAYVAAHTQRGECQCGLCVDKEPDRQAPKHSVDVHFFWVSTKNEPTREELSQRLVSGYPNLDRLRGGPSYIELGGVLGDQGVALQLIGLGKLVGLWDVMTPELVGVTGAEAADLAGKGFVMAGQSSIGEEANHDA